jgi:tetratricopeptide (TPR) repeat protein
MPRARLTVVIFSLDFLISLSALGQVRPGMPTAAPTPIGPPAPGAHGSVTIIVADENGANLGEQALVKLHSQMNQTNKWGTTEARSQITFDDVPASDYEVGVSAAGYQTATKNLSVMTAQHHELLVRLKRDDSGADPTLFRVNGSRRRPARRSKIGIAALNAGNVNQAQKHLGAAYKLAPSNADVTYLMGLLYFKRKDTTQAETYWNKTIAINPEHVRALTSLGQLRLQQKDYSGSVSPLEQATSVDPGFWMAHFLLADAYLRNGEFERSRQQAELAIEKGKGAANGSELVLGEALANLGRREDAIRAFEAFLQQSPGNQAAPAVREMMARLQSSDEPASQEMPANGGSALSIFPPVLSAPETGLSIPTWHPLSVDEEKPLLASGTVCPSSAVIAGAGRRVKELVDNVGRFEATEQVLHEELDSTGKPFTAETRKFDYMASIAEVTGRLAVEEYRTSLTDRGDFPDHISTLGLAGLALAFHPLLRDDYEMTCEGLGRWQGQATWLVYFRQRPDKPSRLLSYAFTNASYAVPLKGRAWIAADTMQIVHLEADLLNPLPRIQLLGQHQAVDYGPVYFQTKKAELWLPKSAELYFDFRHHRYHRRHSFEKYKLFSVGASERIGEPKMADPSKAAAPDLEP